MSRGNPMIPRRNALLLALCLAWILPGLVGHDPWKTEEAYTMGAVHALLLGGSWIVPQLAGEPFLLEPPLFHISAAFSAQLFSFLLPVHDAASLAGGLYIALALLFCGLAGRELNESRQGALAAMLLLGCFGLVMRGHQLISDVAALAGFAMAYYGLALALRRALPGGLWLGSGLGVVFMTQGVPEAAMVMVLALLLPLAFGTWRSRGYVLTLLAALLAASPWLAIWPALLHTHSPQLFAEWLWTYNMARLSGDGSSLFYYLRILPWYGWPVWALALWTLWRERSGILGKPALQLPLAGFVVTLAMLGAAGEARELHALPLLLPLTLLAAPAIATLRRGAANAWYWFSVMGFTFFIAVAWFYWAALELGFPARLHQHLHTIRPGYDFGFKWLPFACALAYTAAWFALLKNVGRTPERPVIVWASGITVIWALLATLFIGWADTAKSYRTVMTGIQRALPAEHGCVSSRNLGEAQRALLHYHAGIITHREEAPLRRRDCNLLLVQGKPLDENLLPEEWKQIWEGHRPGDKDERYRLYQRNPGKPSAGS
jgi:4-amino-4-deoxy-L-arabinose transferase-like glycosyltransferase